VVAWGVPEIFGAAASAFCVNKNANDAKARTSNDCTPSSGVRTFDVNIDDPRRARREYEDVAAANSAALSSAVRVLRQLRFPEDCRFRNGGFASPSCDGFAFFKTLQGIFFNAKKRSPARGIHRYAGLVSESAAEDLRECQRRRVSARVVAQLT
jgi:hypothetical protein